MGPGNRPLDLEWLEDFLALAETGNFSRAAEARSIAQPAFSRHIRALEEWVGVDSYDPIQQIGLLASRPLAQSGGEAMLEPCRDFTYQELSLLHHVAGFTLEEVWHDLDERDPTATYFDAALLLRKTEPRRSGGTTPP